MWEPLSRISDLANSQEFLRRLQNATLADSGLDSDTLQRLEKPIEEPVSLPLGSVDRFSLDTFLADINSSEETYTSTRASIERNTGFKLHSFHDTKRLLRQVTGVTPMVHDMCTNSCIALMYWTGRQ